MLQAAESGHVAAQTNVGAFCFDGQGTKKNRTQGMLWSKRAVRLGDPVAAVNIGLEYLETGSRSRARHWFLKAVSMGDGSAKYHLGKLLLQARSIARRNQGIELLKSLLRTKLLSRDERDEIERLVKP
ncbi:MAG: sel1 repeat family protein [Xanthomonadales bacterium]|nr:sel1 repeat family protein [Xanthomonadales bacterium]